ncbi:hypothetical protein MQE36_12795 [Zhouia spongiae]|uniref:Calx-beta domain-containing protein n=1 Tax=Zhouia spongiae TaxID=2202721 RepID=A0ABY3YK31_9FLAO|nr:hypothetical protein [Zhouia spongiae]UNY97960.1 hypothetical protein MQE36_12795 [Zhouia spongiae]
MKKNKLVYLLSIVCVLLQSCSDDDTVNDPVFEFISFQSETITVSENAASIESVPVTLRLYGYEPKEAITVNLATINNNVEEGVDYSLSGKSITFKPGSFISDTLFVSTIDNASGSDSERSFSLNIESISNPDIKSGLGIENPSNASLKIVIADDECTRTIDVFNAATLSNQNDKGTTTISSVLNGNVVTLTGDLMAYAPFSNATLDVTLIPASEGATKGEATFGIFDAGTDSSGYTYQFRQVGEGTYDVCSGEILIEFEVYWLEGEIWEYWYTSNNRIRL